MPELKTRLQQPTPVSAQVELPPDFPQIPQEILDRFPAAAEWQAKLDAFWARSNAAIQGAQEQAANYSNSRVTYSVDTFRIYAKNGIPQPMFAVDSTGVKLGDTLVISTAGRKVFIGEGQYADAGTPFYIDTLGKFSLGANLTWNPDTSTLNITGTITATSGNIGGFDIGADYIRDVANSMGLASTVTGGDDVRFWAGATFANRATAPFFVTEAGNITANNATIVGTISGRSTATVAATINAAGNVITDLINARLDTSAKTMLSDFSFGAADYSGALKSGTITWNTTTGALTGGSGVLVFRGGIIGAAAGVATFTIDAATGAATFAGALSAPTGNIGGFTLGTDYIRDAADSMGLASTVTGGDDVRFWAGATFANRATAPFRVTEAGALVATSATITGSITATTGAIGGFDIGTDYIRDAANSMGMASTVTVGDDVRFWAGATFANRASAPFFVTEAGALTASSATIAGTISGRSTATVAATINAAGNVITDLINARLDSSAKTMLSDFTFGAVDYSGALKSGTITWNTTTGAITGGSGVLVFRGGIIAAASGVATITLDAATGAATFAGALSAPTGNIGGFTLGADYIRDTADSFGLASTVTVGDDVRFWAGAAFASRATAPFRVTEAGVVTATSGTVGGWTLASTTLTGGSATLDSAGVLTLGTSNDVVIASASDATYRLWIGHATAASAPFRVTKAGVLTASGATVSGTITATAGAIGGFDVGSDYIRDSANSFGMASTVTGGDDVRFWAGATFANRATAPFRLTEAGALTATSGTIAGFTINSSSLTYGSGATLVDVGVASSLPFFQLGDYGSSDQIVISRSGYSVAASSGSSGGELGYELGSSLSDIKLRLVSSGGTEKVTLNGETGDGTLTGTIRSNSGFNYNGTAGYNGTIVVATTTSITVSGGIITGIT